MASCPSSTPFRRTVELRTGIELPDFTLRDLRDRTEAAASRLSGPARVMTFACEHAAGRRTSGAVTMPCAAMLPPSMIDFVLSKGLADGVIVAGCAESACYNRLGARWTKERFARARDPYLRTRVPRERLATIWASPGETQRYEAERTAFVERIALLPPARSSAPPRLSPEDFLMPRVDA
jgi:coenzyme F420-reducing hydrogenase delta subunit